MIADVDHMRRWLIEEAVFEPHFAARDKRDALRKMADRLLRGRDFSTDDIEQVANALHKREFLGSTGIGRGVAQPHTKTPLTEGLIAGWFRLDEPIEFEALDGEPVWFIFCLISPQDRPGDHLRTVGTVSRMFRVDSLLQPLRLGVEQLGAGTISKLFDLVNSR